MAPSRSQAWICLAAAERCGDWEPKDLHHGGQVGEGEGGFAITCCW